MYARTFTALLTRELLQLKFVIDMSPKQVLSFFLALNKLKLLVRTVCVFREYGLKDVYPWIVGPDHILQDHNLLVRHLDFSYRIYC